eukprot:IDg7567t1
MDEHRRRRLNVTNYSRGASGNQQGHHLSDDYKARATDIAVHGRKEQEGLFTPRNPSGRRLKYTSYGRYERDRGHTRESSRCGARSHRVPASGDYQGRSLLRHALPPTGLQGIGKRQQQPMTLHGTLPFFVPPRFIGVDKDPKKVLGPSGHAVLRRVIRVRALAPSEPSFRCQVLMSHSDFCTDNLPDDIEVGNPLSQDFKLNHGLAEQGAADRRRRDIIRTEDQQVSRMNCHLPSQAVETRFI